MLPDEGLKQWNDVVLSIKKTWEPKTVEEEALTEEIANLWWKLRRLVQLETNSVSGLSDPASDHSATLRLLPRYEGSLSRQLRVRIRRLLQLRRSAPNLWRYSL